MNGMIERPERDFGIELGFERAKNPNGDLLGGVFKFGSNLLVGVTEAGIQSQGGPFIFPQSAQRMRVRAGGDVADTAAGLGAQAVEIFGILESGISGSEIVATAGALVSDWTANKFWRVFRVRPTAVGTYGGGNVGDVNIENEDDLDLICQIPLHSNSSLHLAYSTAINEKALMTAVIFSVEANKNPDIHVWTRCNFTNVTPPFDPAITRKEFPFVPEGIAPFPRFPHLLLPPLTDVWVTAQAPSGTAAVAGALSLITAPHNGTSL